MEKCPEGSGQDETEGKGAHKTWHWGASLSPLTALVSISITRVGVWECAVLCSIWACGIPRGWRASGEHRAPASPRQVWASVSALLPHSPAESDTGVWEPVKLLQTSGQHEIWGTEKWIKWQAEESDTSRKWSINHMGHPKWSLPLGSVWGRVGKRAA